MDAIHTFVDLIDAVTFDSLPGEVVDRAKRFILDTLGVALAGTTAPGCKEVFDVYADWGGKEESTVWLFGQKGPSYSTAMLNSLFSHARDFDDTFDDSALHALATTFPTALALGEREKVSGKDLIAAVVSGVEIVVRLGLAIRRPLSWVRTATCGGFGATAAAGKILKLSKREMLGAFGVVYSMISGNAQCLLDGGLSKRLQPGFAVSSGIQSAILAQNGIDGAKEILEGPYGFFNLYERGEYDREKLVTPLENRYHIMDLSFKPYPACRMTHATIQAVLDLNNKAVVAPDNIENVRVEVSPMVFEMVGNPFKIRENPQVDAQFSIPYTVAVALSKGDVFIEDFEESVVRSSNFKDLTDKVTVFPNKKLPPNDMKCTSVEITLKNGRRLKTTVNTLKGSPSMDMDWDACLEKFEKCVPYSAKKFSRESVEVLTDRVRNLEKLKDVSLLTESLAA